MGNWVRSSDTCSVVNLVQSSDVYRGVSDAKKKALYESNVFASDTVEAQPTSHVISENKKKEYSGNDIFHKSDIPEVSLRQATQLTKSLQQNTSC